MKYLVPFDYYQSGAEINVSEVGQKAASLITMLEAEVLVPNGAILTTAGFTVFVEHNSLQARLHAFTLDIEKDIDDLQAISQKCDQIKDCIKASLLPVDLITALEKYLVNKGDHSFAVRSSGTKEDLEDSSFAGLYHTSLYVQGLRQIEQAIKACWASLFDPKVVVYCMQKGVELSDLHMAVVIQEMVLSEKSGVAFTVNPISGKDDEIIIEACYGLGEAMVSGLVTPDQYICDWYTSEVREQNLHTQVFGLFADVQQKKVVQKALSTENEKGVLTSGELNSLVTGLTQLQAYYGQPIDVEWAIEQGRLYFTQARPITSIDYHQQEIEWTTADFKDGGVSSTVCTRFMYSLYKEAWEGSMREYLHAVNMRDNRKIERGVELFYGRPYWNLSVVKQAVRKIPGFVEREFDQSVGVELTYKGDGVVTPVNPRTVLSGLQILHGIRKFARQSKRDFESFKNLQIEHLKLMESKSKVKQTQDFLDSYCELVENDYYRSEASYFRHIYITNNLTTLLKDATRKYLSEFEFIELISGLSDLSHVRLSKDIWSLSRTIMANEQSLSYWQVDDTDTIASDLANAQLNWHFDELRELLQTHKYRSLRELDISEPCFIEAPETVIAAIKDALTLDEAQSPVANERRQSEQFKQNLKAFASKLPIYKRNSTLAKLAELREFLWWREEYRDLSTQHYYYLRIFTLRLGHILIDRGVLASPEQVFNFDASDLVKLARQELDEQQARTDMSNNLCYYQSYRNFTPPDEIGSRKQLDQKSAGHGNVSELQDQAQDISSRLTGIACSTGQVVGTARVITSIHEASRLQEGDILVTRFTDPGWTTKFALIHGVVTETGGLLSHAAVISREYGIPAVLAVKDATSKISDGDQIMLDGQSGTVEIIM